MAEEGNNKKKNKNVIREDETKNKITITEGVIIAAIPLVGYAISLAFEIGYYVYFKIPLELIEIGFVNIILATGFLILFYILVNAFFNLLSPFADLIPGPILRGIVTVTPFLLVTVFSIILFGLEWREWIIYAAFSLILVIITFIHPLIMHSKTKGYVKKLAAADEIDDRTILFHERLLGFFKPYVGTLIYIVVLSLFLSYIGGRAFAFRKREFLVIKTEPEKVILKIHKDKFICAYFDKNKKIVKNNYFVLKIPEKRETPFRWEKLGQLRPDRQVVSARKRLIYNN